MESRFINLAEIEVFGKPVSYTACPEYVEIVGVDSSKGPYKLHSIFYGRYRIQPGTIDGKAWYVKEDNYKMAIWYSYDRWMVGNEDYKGTVRGVASNFEQDDCPHQVLGNSWKYYVTCIDDFIEAKNNFNIIPY